MSTIPLSQAKTHLARLLSEVEELGERVTITRSGHPVGVLLSVEDYEGLLETLDILSDPELSATVRRGIEELADGKLVSHEEAWRDLDDPLHR